MLTLSRERTHEATAARSQLWWPAVLVAVILLLAAVLYLRNGFQSFMDDDEGGYAYAAWRIASGEVPYRDFLTPQMPAFLYTGGLIVKLLGRSFVPLRVATMLAMLGAAYLLFRTNRALFGAPVALLSLPLFLVQNNVFHNARLFRPEAYMLLLGMGGIYAFVLAEQRKRWSYLWLASLLLGFSMLFKLFGFLFWAGCFLYLVFAWWRERRPFTTVLRQGIGLAWPGLLLLAAAVALFSWITPYFITAVFRHHTMQGADRSWAERLAQLNQFGYWTIQGQHLALAVGVVGAALLWRRRPALMTLPIWQFPTLLGFFVLTRDLYTRHVTYLAPALATLMAVAIWGLWHAPWWERWRSGQARALRVVATAAPPLVALALSLWVVRWWAHANYVQAESRDLDTLRLAALVREHTDDDDLVICDYLGINFAAERRSTYWGAGLSEGATKSGQISASRLIGDMEQGNVAMVLIHAYNGTFHIVEMPDYYDLRSYVHGHYALVDRFHRGGQLIEVYSRDDTLPYQPDITYQEQLLLSGAQVAQTQVSSDETLSVGLRWQALRQMDRDYHLALSLVDAQGHVWAEYSDHLKEHLVRNYVLDGVALYDFKTSLWHPPRTVWQDLELPLRPGTPPGTYYLVARVFEWYSGLELTAESTVAPSTPQGEPALATIEMTPPATPLAAEALDPALALEGLVASGLEIVGSSALPQNIMAGRTLDLELFWHATAAIDQGQQITFHLIEGDQVAQSWTTEVASGYPVDTWRPGESVIGHYSLPLRADLPAGDYGLVMAADSVSAQRVELGQLEVRPRVDASTVHAEISHPLEGVDFAGHVGLLGYNLSSDTVEPGGWVQLTLYWECRDEMAQSYVVFTHLLDAATEMRGQRDAVPGGGAAPTSSWQPGDVIVDVYDIQVDPAATAGDLQIEVGWYEPFSEERLPLMEDGVPSGVDYLILPSQITVR